MAGKPSKYSPELQQEIVALARSGQPHSTLARQYGCARGTIRRWVANAQPELNGTERVSLAHSERAQNRLLLRENRQLREERKLLKKAIALFALDNGGSR